MAQTAPEAAEAVVPIDPPVDPHAVHAVAEGAGHGSGGLPQFDPQWWPGQIFWLLIIFVVLYVLLSKVLLPRLGGAIETRARTIADDIESARKLKDEAEAASAAAAAEVAEARGRAQKLSADARAKATAEAAQRQAAEDAVLATRLDEAEGRIRAAREAAMGHVQTIARDTAVAITEKLTGRAATAGELDAAAARS